MFLYLDRYNLWYFSRYRLVSTSPDLQRKQWWIIRILFEDTSVIYGRLKDNEYAKYHQRLSRNWNVNKWLRKHQTHYFIRHICKYTLPHLRKSYVIYVKTNALFFSQSVTDILITQLAVIWRHTVKKLPFSKTLTLFLNCCIIFCLYGWDERT